MKIEITPSELVELFDRVSQSRDMLDTLTDKVNDMQLDVTAIENKVDDLLPPTLAMMQQRAAGN